MLSVQTGAVQSFSTFDVGFFGDNPGILGMVFSVSYDEETLKLIDCQNGLALPALAFQEPSRLISGCNFVWYGSETGEVMDGEMLILTFEIAESAKPSTYPVSIS